MKCFRIILKLRGSQLRVCNTLKVCLKVFDSTQSTRCSLTKCGQMPWFLYETTRFHFAVGLYSDNAQRTSKRGGKSVTLQAGSFNVLTSSVRYQNTRPTAKWNLFVKYNRWRDVRYKCITFRVGQTVKTRHNNQIINTNLIWQPGELSTKYITELT